MSGRARVGFQDRSGPGTSEIPWPGTFIGNSDPTGVLAQGTPATVERRTHKLIDIFAHEARFILNPGCAIPASTPSENLRAMIRAARERWNALDALSVSEPQADGDWRTWTA